MTLWEVYVETRVTIGAIHEVEIERLHSTWETFDEAMKQAGEMLGHVVRVRERFEDR